MAPLEPAVLLPVAADDAPTDEATALEDVAARLVAATDAAPEPDADEDPLEGPDPPDATAEVAAAELAPSELPDDAAAPEDALVLPTEDGPPVPERDDAVHDTADVAGPLFPDDALEPELLLDELEETLPVHAARAGNNRATPMRLCKRDSLFVEPTDTMPPLGNLQIPGGVENVAHMCSIPRLFPSHRLAARAWCMLACLGLVACQPESRSSQETPPVALASRLLKLVDVALLYPLPRSLPERDSGLLQASTEGRGGALLPASVFNAMGPVRSFGIDQAYAELRVVSLRLDPCASNTAPDTSGQGCAAELRLVLQPIFGTPNDNGVHEAADAALHTFYAITRDEAVALLNDLVAARVVNTQGDVFGALEPHPLLQRQGLLGAFAQDVRRAILARAGAQNLVKIAVLSGEGPNQWDFSVHRVQDAQTPMLERLDIPTLAPGTQKQSLLSGFGLPTVAGQFSPEPAQGDVYKELAVTAQAPVLSTDAQRAQFDALMRIENPNLNTPQTVSCALCHFSQTTKELVVRPLLGLADQDSAFVYAPNRQLLPDINVSARFNTQASAFQVHAFGYVASDVVIIQRIVNDSAASLEFFLSIP